MVKVMIFIDGSWVYKNLGAFRKELADPAFEINYKILPQVLSQMAAEQLHMADVDTVRTYFFASYPVNYDPVDEELVEKQWNFYRTLKEDYHYETVLFPIDFRRHRIPAEHRPGFRPKEKCVDIALATEMLFLAAIPHTYDVAIPIIGDGDYKPLLQSVRRLGRRVCITSVRGSCARDYSDPADPERVRDLDTIFLNDILDRIRLVYEKHQLECEDRGHEGPKRGWTTYHPRRGEKFYCEPCRERHKEERAEARERYVAPSPAAASRPVGGTEHGVINSLLQGCGFIGTIHGSFFFHHSELRSGVDFEDLKDGDPVEFTVWRWPDPQAQDRKKRNGEARDVRRAATEQVESAGVAGEGVAGD